MNRRLDLARKFWDTAKRFNPLADAAPSTPVPSGPLSRDVATAIAQLDTIRRECRALVTRRASLSAGAAVVPLPMLDLGTDIAILLKLLPEINERFGLTPEQIEGLDADTKRAVMLFIGSVGSSLVGRIVTRELVLRILMRMGVRITTKGIVKFVPLIGQAVSASISFGAMKLLGNKHIEDCYEIARRTLLDRAGSAADGTWEVVG